MTERKSFFVTLQKWKNLDQWGPEEEIEWSLTWSEYRKIRALITKTIGEGRVS